ncbi:MAG: tetratricopeptide repeat protein [Bdellovibrionota bacterium]
MSEYKRADELLKKGEAAEALSLLEAITRREPQNPKAWFELAGAFDFLGRESEALPHYERALALGIDSLPAEDRPRLFVQMGSTLRNLKKYSEAKKLLTSGLELFPGHGAITAFLGLTAYSNGSYRAAARHFLAASLAPAGDHSLQDYARALRFYNEKLDTFPARQRNWMRIFLHKAQDSPGAGTLITAVHAPALARLMDNAYRGTIDHEGETLAQCEEEMRGTIGGKYGPFLANASFVNITGDQTAAAASMITLWKELPLLAFSMSDPAHQGRGLAGALIRKSMFALKESGYEALYLVVTEGNVPAERLYRKLGFEFLGPARPGRGVNEQA